MRTWCSYTVHPWQKINRISENTESSFLKSYNPIQRRNNFLKIWFNLLPLYLLLHLGQSCIFCGLTGTCKILSNILEFLGMKCFTCIAYECFHMPDFFCRNIILSTTTPKIYFLHVISLWWFTFKSLCTIPWTWQ